MTTLSARGTHGGQARGSAGGKGEDDGRQEVGFWLVVAVGMTLSSPASRTGTRAAAAAEQAEGRGPATIAGCPAAPVRFYPCAKEKSKTFTPPRTPTGHPTFRATGMPTVRHSISNRMGPASRIRAAPR